MISRAWLVYLLPLIFGCSSGQSKPSSTAPPPPSWTGTWARLDGLAIPREKQIRLTEQCDQTPDYWTIEQTKSQITLELHPGQVASGVRMTVVRKKFEKATGTLRDSSVHLDGDGGTVDVAEGQRPMAATPKFPVAYDLQYDPKTEHLAGTRNGAPIRFIRAELHRADNSQCVPPP